MENSRYVEGFFDLLIELEKSGLSDERIKQFEDDQLEYAKTTDRYGMDWNENRNEESRKQVIHGFIHEVFPDPARDGLTPEAVQKIAETWFDVTIHQTDGERRQDLAEREEAFGERHGDYDDIDPSDLYGA